jgi:NIMA (never in mitosis gene a)-related kinase
MYVQVEATKQQTSFIETPVAIPKPFVVDDKFEKIRILGRGAYGIATLYRRKEDEELVVVKEINLSDLKPKDRGLASNEMKVLSLFDHPNVIGYFDSSELDGVVRIEMEYADGGNLSQWIARQKTKIPERRVLHMFKQITSALAYVHSHNVCLANVKLCKTELEKCVL